jgi:hypothetical protein
MDGKLGGATTKAIHAYQHSLGQPETGQLTPLQLHLLWHPAVSKAGNAAPQLQPMTPAR